VPIDAAGPGNVAIRRFGICGRPLVLLVIREVFAGDLDMS
jgi:hypothetical protein